MIWIKSTQILKDWILVKKILYDFNSDGVRVESLWHETPTDTIRHDPMIWTVKFSYIRISIKLELDDRTPIYLVNFHSFLPILKKSYTTWCHSSSFLSLFLKTWNDFHSEKREKMIVAIIFSLHYEIFIINVCVNWDYVFGCRFKVFQWSCNFRG